MKDFIDKILDTLNSYRSELGKKRLKYSAEYQYDDIILTVKLDDLESTLFIPDGEESIVKIKKATFAVIKNMLKSKKGCFCRINVGSPYLLCIEDLLNENTKRT